MKNSTFVIVTATVEADGAFDSKANQERNHKLLVYLRTLPFDYTIARGTYRGIDQGPSFVIWGMGAGQGLQLANSLEQESFIVSNPGGAGLVYCNGRGYQRAIGELHGDAAREADNCTVLPDGTAFSLVLS